VRSTWAPRGRTPVLVHHFNWQRASIAAALCFGSAGGGCQLAFHVQPGSYNTQRLIGVLEELRRFLGGQKATLVWDGLPAHRSKAMAAWIASQRHWLVAERLPAYAPELNPTEACGATSRARAASWPTLPATRWRRSSAPPSVASSGSVARRTCRIRFFVTADSTCGSDRHPRSPVSFTKAFTSKLTFR
jgi:DDE superfamily endonuclease